MPAEERSPGSSEGQEGSKAMITDESLAGLNKVQKFQKVLYAKAKAEPEFRFYSLSDKMWRDDFLREAYRRVRRNGGMAGVDGESFADIEAKGLDGWLGNLSQDLRCEKYKPQAVLEVKIPKKEAGKYRKLGIPCIRDRVVQTAAMLILSPIFEADLQDEQYAYRAQRSANDAVNRVHSLLNRGFNEVVDCDLSNYFGEIPHAQLMKSVARRVSDGRMLGLIKAWLEMPTAVKDGNGGRPSCRARKQRKGTPQGAPISPLLSNVYMRRFIVGWKQLGFAQRFGAHIVCYADDLSIFGRSPARQMLMAVEGMMNQLQLPINRNKTRCLRCPQESMEFLGYRIGWNYRNDGSAYIGTRPSKASVQNLCRKVSELTSRKYGLMESREMVRRLNWTLSGWSNYFHLGQVYPAYTAINLHTTRRLRQWFSRKHQARTEIYVRFSDKRLWMEHGLIRLSPKT